MSHQQQPAVNGQQKLHQLQPGQELRLELLASPQNTSMMTSTSATSGKYPSVELKLLKGQAEIFGKEWPSESVLTLSNAPYAHFDFNLYT